MYLDVRQEAVKQALEQFGARPIPSSKRILNPQTKRRNIRHFVFRKSIFFYSGESTDDDEDDDESSSTYATTTDDQHNKESSISPVPIPVSNHHYQNPPSVESILKSKSIPSFSRPTYSLFRYSSTTITIHIFI